MENIKRKIALFDSTGNVGYKRLNEIATAIQIQLVRDIAPKWGVEGQVVAYKSLDDIPTDFWIATIVHNIPERSGVNGYHDFTGTGDSRRAFAKIIYQNWTDFDFTQSRFEKVIDEEIIEMSINPFLDNRLVGKDPEFPDKTATFLVELGDPGNRLDIGYYINDVFVTDFIYPSYYNAIHVEGTKYDHLGLIPRPYSIVDGGYQIFQRAGQWYNALKIQGKLYFIKQGDELPAEATNEANTIFLLWFLGIFIGLFFIFLFVKSILNKSQK